MGFQFNVPYEVMYAFAYGAAMWLPVVFVAYSVGCRQLKVWPTVTFAIAEVAAVVAFYLALTHALAR